MYVSLCPIWLDWRCVKRSFLLLSIQSSTLPVWYNMMQSSPILRNTLQYKACTLTHTHSLPNAHKFIRVSRTFGLQQKCTLRCSHFCCTIFFAWKQSKGGTLKRNGGCRLPCRSKPSQHLVTISVTGLFFLAKLCQSSVQCKNIMEEAEQAPSNHLLSISRHHGVQCHRH